MSLYPLKFEPRYLEKMWGGRKIETVLGKKLPTANPTGESWELYDFPPGIIDNSGNWVSSKVVNGPLAGRTLHEIVAEFGRDLHGDVPLVGPHGQFPILIKFLDAEQDLSVQVHPDREYARTHADAHLKSEAWYIVQSDPGARLLKGLKPGSTRQSLAAAVRDGKVESLINSIPVKPGDCFYLPSGTVHALGAGILAAEVQTPSDTTYRVHDFDRVDPSTGKLRTLHVDQAMECIDFSHKASATPLDIGSNSSEKSNRLVNCEFFGIEKMHAGKGAHRELLQDQPIVWMILDGRAQIKVADGETTAFGRGDTILLPAKMRQPRLEILDDCVWLEVTFPTAR